MVVCDKKICDIHITIDICNLNVACLHYSFLTPFTYDVLENIGDYEVYSFIDGLYGYNYVYIVEEGHENTTFVTEWVPFSYNAMTFGFRNALVVFSRIMVMDFKEFMHMFLEVYLDY